jgi:uncharacterized protein YdhG (YjbR/CyaY superfamily)
MADTKASGARGLLSEEEKAAVRETVKERRKAAKLSPEEQRIEGEADVQARIAEMPADDRKMAARIHDIVRRAAPELVPRTFYGMPAYSKDGKVICFFQSKSKFKVRYSTLGFQHDAALDDGTMWPVAFALLDLTEADEKKIAQLVKKAGGRDYCTRQPAGWMACAASPAPGTSGSWPTRSSVMRFTVALESTTSTVSRRGRTTDDRSAALRRSRSAVPAYVRATGRR